MDGKVESKYIEGISKAQAHLESIIPDEYQLIHWSYNQSKSAYYAPYQNELLLEDAFEDLEKLSSSWTFDMIYAHDWMYTHLARRLAEKINVPFISHVHSTFFSRKDSSTSHIEKDNLLRASNIIVVSHKVKHEIIDNYGLDADKIKVIPPLPLEFEKTFEHTHNHLLDDGLLNSKSKKILFLGRVVEEKGISYFVESSS